MAALLLAVYLPLVASLSLHVHEHETQSDALCGLCVSHVLHHDHLYSTGSSNHECLLCQLGATLYVAAKQQHIPAPYSVIVVMSGHENAGFPSQHGSVLKTRAPPHGTKTRQRSGIQICSTINE